MKLFERNAAVPARKLEYSQIGRTKIRGLFGPCRTPGLLCNFEFVALTSYTTLLHCTTLLHYTILHYYTTLLYTSPLFAEAMGYRTMM